MIEAIISKLTENKKNKHLYYVINVLGVSAPRLNVTVCRSKNVSLEINLPTYRLTTDHIHKSDTVNVGKCIRVVQKPEKVQNF